MLALFALTVLLILYGTLYPFAFAQGAQISDIAVRFAESAAGPISRGDVLSNVILFLPLGFFGIRSLANGSTRVTRLILVWAFGSLLSFAIECTQTFIVGRDTSVVDLLLNSTGTLVGACVGLFDWNVRLAGEQKSHRPLSFFPVILLGAWLALRLFPFVPTLDFQHVKDAVKPLFADEIAWLDVVRYFVVSLVVGRLLQALVAEPRARLAMPVLVFGVVAAKPFLLTRVLSLAEIVGVTAAVVVWLTLLHRQRMRTPIVAALVMLQVVLQGLLPFTPTGTHGFSWMPFSGFESGSMAVNLQAFLEKIFLYGSLVWLLAQSGMRLLTSVVVSAAFLAWVELTQTTLAGRTSEITDPLLAVLMGIALYAFERAGAAANPRSTTGGRL